MAYMRMWWNRVRGLILFEPEAASFPDDKPQALAFRDKSRTDLVPVQKGDE